MKVEGKKSKVVWIVAGVILIAGIIAVTWTLLKKDLSKPGSQSRLKPLIADQFKKMIAEASDSLYQVSYSSFDVDIESGTANIRNLQLLPDSSAYQRLLSSGKAPDNVFKVTADAILLDGFGFIKPDSVNRFNINTMRVKSPSVTISNKLVGREDSVVDDKHGALYKLTQKIFKRMSVGRIFMDDLDFMYVNKNEKEEKYNLLSNLNIIISDFSTSPAPSGKGAVAHTGLFRMATPDSLYYLVFKGMSFSAPERRLFTDHFTLQPRLNKSDFYKKVKFSKDRYHFEYDKISMNNIDIDRFLKTQQISMGSMNIGNSWVEVYTNYNWPARNVPARRNAFPHDQLQTLAFDITIDTMNMKHGDIFFRILAKNSKEVSTLSMRNSSGRFLNVTNNTARKRKNPYTIVSMHTRVMNQGLMNVRYKFNLVDKSAPLNLYSTMGPMDAKALNPLSVPLGLMEVTEGRINKMELNLNMDEYKAKGNLNFYYEGVKVDFLKRDEDENKLKKRGFLSFVNNTILPNDNPRRSGDFKKGPINVIREPRDSFFGFLWEAMADGMSSAMMGTHQDGKKPDKNPLLKIGSKVAGPDNEKEKGRKNETVK